MNIVTWIMRALLMSSVVIVTACGGGSGGPSENVAPRASELAIKSRSSTEQTKFSVGDLLEAHYEYFDADGDLQGDSQILWYSGESIIYGENSAVYSVRDTDAGKKISFSVTPIALTGQSQGQTVRSDQKIIEHVTPQPDPTDDPVSISISGPQSVARGANATLNATVRYSSGSLDSNVTWSSNDTSILTVTSAGQITGMSAGTAVISAAAGDVVQTHTVEVFETTTAVVTGISIAGASSSTLTVNQMSTLSASVEYSDGNTHAMNVNWSSNNTSVATVNSMGMVAAVAAGTARITASFDGWSDTHQVTVQAPDATLQSVSASGVAEVEEGQNAQYTATLHYSDGSSMQGAVQWSSSSSSIASINSSGLLTANSPGQVTLTATSGTLSASINVTITEADVEVTLQSVSINGSAGVLVGESVSLSATASYSDGSSESVAAAWSTNNASVSLSAASGASVDVSGVSAGSSTVTASFGGMSDSHVITVTEPSGLVSIEIFPKTLRTNTTALQQAVAVGTDADGHKMGLTHLVNWSSSNSNAVSIGATGELSIQDASGSATITASYAGVEATYNVTELDVGPPPGFFLYFRKPDHWQNAKFYVFVTGDNVENAAPTGAWGEFTMSAAPEMGDAWYSVEVLDSYISSGDGVNFIFHDQGGTNEQSADLYRTIAQGSQWWTWENNQAVGSDTPPNDVNYASVATVKLKVVDSSVIYTDENPGENLAEADVAVGSVLNIDYGDAPIGSTFSNWDGDAALYVVNPNVSPARMVAVDVTTMTLQANFEQAVEDLHADGRNAYYGGCDACHAEGGAGFGSFPAVTIEAMGNKYPTIDALADYIETDMLGNAPGACSGVDNSTCAYDIAAMIFADAWEEPENVAACNVNSYEDMAPSDRNLRMLTKVEYINSVEDIFGIDVDASILSGISDARAVNYNTASFLMPSEERISMYDLAAGQLAEQIINARGFSGLTSSCGSNAQCVAQELGMKVFRRPLSAQEVSRYASLYSAEDGGESFVHGLLLSPFFLMRSEMGVLDNATGFYRLTNYEVATLLSYTFWGTTPDDTLLQAAASANFDIQAQVNRLLNSEKAETAFVKFIEGWLFDNRYNFPAITDGALQSDLREETVRFVTEIVFGGLDYEELLTANYSYMNSNVASHYGEQVSGSGWQRVEYSGDNVTRSGVIGHASFLATHTSSERTSPIKRGVYLRRALLCQEFPEPVAATEPEAPDPSMSFEDRFRLHTEDEGCQSCHQYIDEAGFSFQNFGMDGRFRLDELAYDRETRNPVDGTGSINSLYSVETRLKPGEGEPFSDMRGLGELLAGSPNAPACYARQFYRYTSGREEKAEDACTINVYGQKFRNGQQNLKELMVELTTMPNYTLRK